MTKEKKEEKKINFDLIEKKKGKKTADSQNPRDARSLDVEPP